MQLALSRTGVQFDASNPEAAALAKAGYEKLLKEAKAYKPPQEPLDYSAPAPRNGRARG